MNKAELINCLFKATQNPLICPVVEEAKRLISKEDVEVVISANELPVDHHVSIWKRRLRHLGQPDKAPIGLEATIANLNSKSGMLRAGYAKKDRLFIGFWIDENSNLQGCVIGEDNRA